jgi:hypothetical protein
MTSSVSGIASSIAAILWQFGLIIAVSTAVAFFAAHKWGATSRRKRQAIYSAVGFIGIIVGLMATIHRPKYATAGA